MSISLVGSRVGVVQFAPAECTRARLVEQTVDRVPCAPCLGCANVCHGDRSSGCALNCAALVGGSVVSPFHSRYFNANLCAILVSLLPFALGAASGRRPHGPGIVLIILTGPAYRSEPYCAGETPFQARPPLCGSFVLGVESVRSTRDLCVFSQLLSYRLSGALLAAPASARLGG